MHSAPAVLLTLAVLLLAHTTSAEPCLVHCSSNAEAGERSDVLYSTLPSSLKNVINDVSSVSSETVVYMLPSDEGMSVMGSLILTKKQFEEGAAPVVHSYLDSADLSDLEKVVHVDGIDGFEGLESLVDGRIYVVNVAPSTPLAQLDASISGAMTSPSRTVLVTSRPLSSTSSSPIRRLAAADTTYYVYMTPNIMAGILFGILFTFCAILGFSCMNDLEGQTVFVSKMPTVGREA